MGCASSKEDHSVPLQEHPRPVISRPSDGMVMVPRTYRDNTGRPIHFPDQDLDRNTILSAFEQMAAYLGEQRTTAQIVTVGGAVNTVCLQSRPQTHDVDFFLENPSSSQHAILGEAAKFANRRHRGALGAKWFNNNTQLFLKRSIQKDLFELARQQNVIVYQKISQNGGLIVWAAPWQYAICGKLGRLSNEGEPRPYDLDDATTYLHEHLNLIRQPSIGANEIRGWCQRYSISLNEQTLHQLDQRYARNFGRQAINFNH